MAGNGRVLTGTGFTAPLAGSAASVFKFAAGSIFPRPACVSRTMSFTEMLIETVKKYPLLFDLSHEDYRNLRKKDKTWDVIGKELNEDGADLKRKWKNLRDTYTKFLRTNKTSTGQRAKKNYRNWQWASQMEAFKPFLNFATTSTNVVDDIEPIEINTSEELESNQEETNEGTPSQRKELDFQQQEAHPDATIPLNSTVPTSQKRIRLKLRQTKEKEEVSSVSAVLDYLKKRSRPSTDAIDLIFQGYAQTLKQFSPTRQAEVKIKIATIMAEAEMRHQEEQFVNISPSTSTKSSELHLDTSSNYSNNSECIPCVASSCNAQICCGNDSVSRTNEDQPVLTFLTNFHPYNND